MRMILLMAALAACATDADEDSAPASGPCGEQKVVFVAGQSGTTCGESCPEGSFTEYVDGWYLACSTCGEAAPCEGEATCEAECGPGCEDDAGGCCPIYSCVE